MNYFRRYIPILAIAAIPFAAQPTLFAEDRVIVVSSAGDLSEGLDLNALGEVFKTSDDLQHFEQQLNNPQLYLNNLDLNGDGQVDFLRVIEEQTENGRMVVVQAIVGDNAFTDVAYIDIQRGTSGQYKVQIRGEEALYGEHSYYVPRYDYVSWPIVSGLWASNYYNYSSPYYWGYYPSWYSSYSCVRHGFYRARVAYRYPRYNFHFSYNAGFGNYSRYHHKSHKYHRDYNWHRKDRKDYDRHPDRGRGDNGNKRTYTNNGDRYNPNYRRADGENRNVSDERIKRLQDRRPDTKKTDRNRINQDRTTRNDSNRYKRITPRTNDSNRDNSDRDIRNRDRSNRSPSTTAKPTTRTRTQENFRPSKPPPSPSGNRKNYSAPKPSNPSRNYSAPNPNKPSRSYSAPKPSKPNRSYSAPKPSTPSRSYEKPRSQPRPSRDYSSRSSNTRTESPRSNNTRSRENSNHGGSGRPKR